MKTHALVYRAELQASIKGTVYVFLLPPAIFGMALNANP